MLAMTPGEQLQRRLQPKEACTLSCSSCICRPAMQFKLLQDIASCTRHTMLCCREGDMHNMVSPVQLSMSCNAPAWYSQPRPGVMLPGAACCPGGNGAVPAASIHAQLTEQGVHAHTLGVKCLVTYWPHPGGLWQLHAHVQCIEPRQVCKASPRK